MVIIWWQSSLLYRATFGFWKWCLGILHGSWLVQQVAGFWIDTPCWYTETLVGRFNLRVSCLLSRFGRWIRHHVAGSLLLTKLPELVLADATWWWNNSLLRRLCVGFNSLVTGDNLVLNDENVGAPPVWRRLAYLFLAGSLLGAFILFPRALGLLRWVVFLLAAGVTWVKPISGLFMTVFLVPFLPALSLFYLAALGTLAGFLRGTLKPSAEGSLLRLLAVLTCLFLLLASLGSADVLPSLRYWRFHLAGLMLFILVGSLKERRQLDQLVVTMLMAGVGVSLLGLWQFVGGTATNISWVDLRYSAISTRVFGPFDNPNMLAGYLVFLLPFAATRLLARKQSWKVRVSNGVLCVLLGLALVLSFSRGGWVAAGLGLLIVVLLIEPRLLWFAPVILLVAPLLLPPVVLQRIVSIVNLDDTSNMVRLHIWNSSWAMAQANWFLGIGLGLIPFARVYPVFQYGVVPAIHTHSLFLQIAVEGGLLAALAFILFNVASWRAGLSKWKSFPFLMVPAVGALLGHVVHGVFDHSWYDPRLLMFYWLLAGLIMATYYLPDGAEAESTEGVTDSL